MFPLEFSPKIIDVHTLRSVGGGTGKKMPINVHTTLYISPFCAFKFDPSTVITDGKVTQ